MRNKNSSSSDNSRVDENVALLHRVAARDTKPIHLSVDGVSIEARDGDSLLAAILTNGSILRSHEFAQESRSGFCLMGACQDCWVWLDDGERARACTALARDGAQVRTSPPSFRNGSNV